MKKIFVFLVIIILLALGYYYKDNIIKFVSNNLANSESKQKLINNKYSTKNNFAFVKLSNDLTIDKKENIKDIFYTVLNSGMNKYTVYCDSGYKACKKDVENFFSEKTLLSNINNFVHPYNSFKNIKVTITNYGKVTINFTKMYDDETIYFVNAEIDDFIKNNINDTMPVEDKIKLFHDYLINNTKFDTSIENTNEEEKINSVSFTAYGLFKNHLAICGGYSDAMAIYLSKLNILNYRISTSEHVWNLVNINNSWKHLDVTWDDPVTSDGSDLLLYDYFLIDTNTLLSKDTTQHNFDKEIYVEAQ